MFAQKSVNFLAHAFLSGSNEEILIGNFVADSIKGKALETYSIDIQQGVFLHRAIDNFTDTHPLVMQCNTHIRPHFRKFSGVVTDIYFDHFLAKNWLDYTTLSLHDFANYVYALLQKNYEILPPQSKRILPWMIQQNWLEGYANFVVLQKVFNGMSNRTSFESGMEKAVEVLHSDYHFFEDRFHRYFPELIQFAVDYLSKQSMK